jgi:hypothetical protein
MKSAHRNFSAYTPYLLRLSAEAEVEKEKEEKKGGGGMLPVHYVGVVGLESPKTSEHSLEKKRYGVEDVQQRDLGGEGKESKTSERHRRRQGTYLHTVQHPP